jgi:hypothetical protein
MCQMFEEINIKDSNDCYILSSGIDSDHDYDKSRMVEVKIKLKLISISLTVLSILLCTCLSNPHTIVPTCLKIKNDCAK